MLPVSGLVRVCFSTNCLTWIAGAQGGNDGVGRPCSSLTTTTPFCKRKAWSGSYHHFNQCLLWKMRINTDPKSFYLLLIFLTACTYLFFITFILTASSSSASSPLFGCCEPSAASFSLFGHCEPSSLFGHCEPSSLFSFVNYLLHYFCSPVQTSLSSPFLYYSYASRAAFHALCHLCSSH